MRCSVALTALHCLSSFMRASVGGAEPASGQHMFFAGSSVTLSQSSEYKIGEKWANGVVKGDVSATVDFQIAAKGVTVSTSLPVSIGGGTHTGDIGGDGKFWQYP